jgi:hypothetical protein
LGIDCIELKTKWWDIFKTGSKNVIYKEENAGS